MLISKVCTIKFQIGRDWKILLVIKTQLFFFLNEGLHVVSKKRKSVEK